MKVVQENVGGVILVVGHEIGRVGYERNPSTIFADRGEVARTVWIAAARSADAPCSATGEISNEHIPQFSVRLQWQRLHSASR